jgi:hypothetical protein
MKRRMKNRVPSSIVQLAQAAAFLVAAALAVAQAPAHLRGTITVVRSLVAVEPQPEAPAAIRELLSNWSTNSRTPEMIPNALPDFRRKQVRNTCT